MKRSIFGWIRCLRVTRLLAVATAFLPACKANTRIPGQLVVAIDTDMALPQQIDTIELQMFVDGGELYKNALPVGGGLDAQPIPATITLVAGPDPSLPVTIRMLGQKNSITRTLREVITTVPTDRIATLRMPVQWLCDGTAMTVHQSDGSVSYESSCGAGSTCKGGRCVVSDVMPSTLESYQAGAIFGGGAAPAAKETTTGTCFDTISCMVSGALMKPDDQCTIPIPAGDDSTLNVALRVANDGICDTTGAICFVPLDKSDEGWTIEAGRIALPPAVCSKLRTGLVAGVVASNVCPTKTPGVPPCGAWSSVVPPADAGVSTGDAATSPPAAPAQVASLAADAGSTSVCCPLTADGSRLYTCLCDGTSTVRVTGIDPSSGAASDVTTFSAKYARSQYAAVLAGGSLYWADRVTKNGGGDACPIYGSPTGGGAAIQLGVVSGDVYDGANLLADAAAIYALADNVSGLGPASSPVQVVRIDRTAGSVTTFDTGGSLPVLQFTQDPAALYVAVDTDVGVDAGVQRISRVVKIAKSGGGSSSTLVQRTVTTGDATHGGFIGLADDGTALFALYEAGPGADATIDTQVLAVDPMNGNTTTLYEEAVDPTVVRLRLLGAVSGSVLLVRDGTSSASGGAGAPSSESTVLVIPRGGGAPRIASSFSRDTPVFGLQAPTFSPDIFWINASGRVYRLPAAGLQ
jgi:hypothetical protein